jgi:hypothetical protein
MDAPQTELQTIFRTMSNALMAQKRGIVLPRATAAGATSGNGPPRLASITGIGQDISDDFNYPAIASSTISMCSTSSTAASALNTEVPGAGHSRQR